MSVSLTITKTKKGYQFAGAMDEFSNQDFYSQHIVAGDFPGNQPIEFDFEKVTRSNSAGLVEWLKFVQGATHPFFYTKCPPWLVGQFNSISQFFPEQMSAVVNFFVPFYCDEDESNFNVLYSMGKEVNLDDLGKINTDPRTIEGKQFVPDFMPDKYFLFLERNKSHFKQFFSSYRVL